MVLIILFVHVGYILIPLLLECPIAMHAEVRYIPGIQSRKQ